jgi:hypothetical protein
MDFQLWNDFEPAVFVFFLVCFCLVAQVATATKVKLQIFRRPKIAIAIIIFKVALGDLKKKFSALTGTHYLYLLYMV